MRRPGPPVDGLPLSPFVPRPAGRLALLRISDAADTGSMGQCQCRRSWIHKWSGAGVVSRRLSVLVVYLSIMTFLALTVGRRFFINDGFSLAFWLAVGGALAFGGARVSRRG